MELSRGIGTETRSEVYLHSIRAFFKEDKPEFIFFNLNKALN
jgi:hypothetical protein